MLFPFCFGAKGTMTLLLRDHDPQQEKDWEMIYNIFISEIEQRVNLRDLFTVV